MVASDSLARLPKADLQVHQEATRYLDLVLAEREGREPYDWSAWRRRLAAELPPGKERLQRIGSVQPVSLEHDNDDELFISRFAALMRDHAAAGACYVEIRCGGEVATRDGFMSMFRQAERQVRAEYPRLRAEVLAIVIQAGQDSDRTDAFAADCIRAAADPELLYLLDDNGVTLECALTCNDYFGVLPELDEHPLLRLASVILRPNVSDGLPWRKVPVHLRRYVC